MTRKNNEERLGVPSTGAKGTDDASIAAMNAMAPNQDLLSYVNPTQIIDLPSAGAFYKEGHPLNGKDTIEIKEMTAKEEDILTSKSLIQKGVVLDRLVQSVLVDKTINVDDLLVGDKNAILVALRISGYGNEYETKVTCPSCGETSKHEFDLSCGHSLGPIDLASSDDEDLREHVKETDSGTYVITLPRTGAPVEVRLLTGKDERRILATQEMKKKKKLPENPLTDHFKNFVVSVAGVEDRHQINKFLEAMPAIDSRFLRKTFSKLTPNIDLTQEFVCGGCGYEQEMEVPFTVDFFWPDR